MPPSSSCSGIFRCVTSTLHAEAAAAISEAAARQGRFWEMHDLLFSNQRHLEDADLRRLPNGSAWT